MLYFSCTHHKYANTHFFVSFGSDFELLFAINIFKSLYSSFTLFKTIQMANNKMRCNICTIYALLHNTIYIL